LRGVALAFVCAYVLLPYSLTAYVPIWLPFLCVLAVEVQFLVGGIRPHSHTRRPSGVRGGPQEHDLVELSEWIDLGLQQGGTLRVGAGELTRGELAHWLALHEAELAELAPGDYEVGPLRLDDGPEARPRFVSSEAASSVAPAASGDRVISQWQARSRCWPRFSLSCRGDPAAGSA
jgi:hypothetical protein